MAIHIDIISESFFLHLFYESNCISNMGSSDHRMFESTYT